MSTSWIAAVFVLPAIGLALTYGSILERLPPSLASPYPRADARKRLLAAALDGSLAIALGLAGGRASPLVGIAAAAAYALLRDMFAGQSIGKLLVGLVVITLDTGRPCAAVGSIKRNILLLLPGANVAAVPLEARTILRDPQGQRLGDRLARTQVIEGFGARDLVKSFQDWLAGIGAEAGREGGRRKRRPWAARNAI